MPDKSRRALTRAEVAELYGVHVNEITKAIQRTEGPVLKAKKVGRQYRIHIDDAEAWFAALPDA